MPKSANGAHCNASLEAVRSRMQIPGFALWPKLNANCILSGTCQYASLLIVNIVLEERLRNTITADLHFLTTKSHFVLTKNFLIVGFTQKS